MLQIQLCCYPILSGPYDDAVFFMLLGASVNGMSVEHGIPGARFQLDSWIDPRFVLSEERNLDTRWQGVPTYNIDIMLDSWSITSLNMMVVQRPVRCSLRTSNITLSLSSATKWLGLGFVECSSSLRRLHRVLNTNIHERTQRNLDLAPSQDGGNGGRDGKIAGVFKE